MQFIHNYWHRTFASLSIRNYRLYFWSQIVSLSGNWLQMIAQAWLVLQLTDSGFLLGLVAGLQFLPTLLLGPWTGSIIDRIPRRQLLYAIQLLGIVSASILGLIVAFDVVELWMVLSLCLLMGITTAFELPARQTFITEIVPDDHMQNAIALSAMEASMARIAGPAVGAFCIAFFSIAGCFFLNAASFLFALVGLMMMRQSEFSVDAPVRHAKNRIRETIHYLSRHRLAETILLMMISVGVFAFEFIVTLPLLAKETFGGDASTYAALMTAMGIGAVVGGLWNAGRPLARSVNTIAIYSLLFGASMVGLGAAPTLSIALGVAALVGVFQIMLITTANTMLMTSVDHEFRGRVNVIWTIIFVGSTPIGGPLMGWVSGEVSPGFAIALGGLTSAASGAWVLARWWLARQSRHPAAPERVSVTE